MKYLKLVCCGLLVCQALAAQVPLVPFFTDPTYERDEPTNPPWFVFNNGQPSHLYHNGSLSSQETGLNDLAMASAWSLQLGGAKVGVVDQTTHGDRVVALVSTMSPLSEVYRHELGRWYPADIAAGIVDCVDQSCRIIVVTTGFSSPDDGLSNACVYASNAVVIVAAPNQDGDLDGGLMDYPYAYNFPNVLYVFSTDRNGNHYSPSATGSRALGAPGRNIVAAGTYSSGTSWAAPIVAGCAALLVERYPSRAPADFISCLLNTVSGPAREVNPTAALLALNNATLAVENTATGIVVSLAGLDAWTYTLESSQDLQTWQDFAVVNGNSQTIVPPGFYRARAN